MLICRQPVYAAHTPSSFNQWLHAELTELAADVQRRLGSNLVALVLGGSYGRGEGGVEWRNRAWAPCHNLDLFVVVHVDLGVQRRLEPIRHRWRARLGVDIDVGRPLHPGDMLSLPRRLQWDELEHGHVLLIGTTPVWCERTKLCCKGIPIAGCLLSPIEATRLLLNRGAGLVQACRIVAGLEATREPDLVRRVCYQAVLAAGDALLLSYERFETSYRLRAARLPRLLEEHPGLLALNLGPLYARAFRFKLNPDHVGEVGLDDVTSLWSAVYLMVESRRCGRVWSSMAEYCGDEHVREPDRQQLWRRPLNAWENMLLGQRSTLHPREWLFRRLPWLIAEARVFDTGWQQESERYLSLWRRHHD